MLKMAGSCFAGKVKMQRLGSGWKDFENTSELQIFSMSEVV
jgi:hypothetical protein